MNIPLLQLQHEGVNVWYAESDGRDICIAREFGTNDFYVWIDAKRIGNAKTLQAAEKLADRFCLLT